MVLTAALHPTALIDEIQTANAKFMNAFAKQDATELSELYTEDCKLMPTGADVVTGRAGRPHPQHKSCNFLVSFPDPSHYPRREPGGEATPTLRTL